MLGDEQVPPTVANINTLVCAFSVAQLCPTLCDPVEVLMIGE